MRKDDLLSMAHEITGLRKNHLLMERQNLAGEYGVWSFMGFKVNDEGLCWRIKLRWSNYPPHPELRVGFAEDECILDNAFILQHVNDRVRKEFYDWWEYASGDYRIVPEAEVPLILMRLGR